MEKKLTYLEAFKSMQCFLENYYEQTDSDDVRSLLGNISLDIWKDGSTGDPAAWSEWIECIEKVTNKKIQD